LGNTKLWSGGDGGGATVPDPKFWHESREGDKGNSDSPFWVAIVSDVENVPDLAMLLAEFATEWNLDQFWSLVNSLRA